MTVSEWIKKNGKLYKFSELTISSDDVSIILDDKLAYLSERSEAYNKGWKSKCRGKKIVRTVKTPKGIVLYIE